MDNLFIIGLLLLCLFLTFRKQNIEHMTDTIGESLLNKISEVTNQLTYMKGMIVMWNGITPPIGWVLCDGKNGTPDLNGKFILSYDSNHAIGSEGGEETHTLTTTEIPAHDHALPTVGGYGALPGKQDGKTRAIRYPISYKSRTTKTGSSSSHNNMPPYYVLAYIMKL
jgi:microcystin-dependent protein